MKIGIDCRTILNPGFGEVAGVGHYTYYLVKHLLQIDQENEYVLFFDKRAGRELIAEVVGGRANVKIKFFPFHEYKQFMPVVYSHFLISSFINREACDVYHSPSGHLPYSYIAPSVITIHDLAIYQHPEWFSESALTRFSSTKILLPRSIAQASCIISPSESTANDLRKLFRVSHDKIKVIPHGVHIPETIEWNGDKVSLDEEMLAPEIKSKYHLGGRYILFLGTIEPRKNIGALIRAFRNLIKSDNQFSDLSLVIAGAKGWKSEHVFYEIRETNKTALPREAVRYLGYVGQNEKFLLMKYAEIFAFPSLYEGFGLPVLEAMALGVPVISSKVSSLPEIVGDSGLLVNPKDEKEIEDAMKKLLNDSELKQKLSESGKKQAENFNWTKTAETTLEVYKSVK